MKHLIEVYRLIRAFVRGLHLIYHNIQVEKQASTLLDFYENLFEDQRKKYLNLPEEAVAISDCLTSIGKCPKLSSLSDYTVSVIIPHYNQPIFLKKALEALAEQTALPYEIIVVDDQSSNVSTEELEFIITESNKRVPTKLIVGPAKLYAGRARQLGAKAAIGNIVIMHDADDVSHPQRVEYTKLLFKKHPGMYHLNVGFVKFNGDFLPFVKDFSFDEVHKRLFFPEQIKERQKGVIEKQLFSTVKKSGIHFGDYSIGHFGVSGGHVAYRKELVDFLEWPSPNKPYFTKYEDYDFNLMLFFAMKGRHSYALDLPLLYYRQGSTTNLVHY